MSLQRVLDTLMILGLKRIDAKIYVFFAKSGPQEARNVASRLGMPKQQIYRSLKTLLSKGLISATSGRPVCFSAVSLEKALDLFIEARREEAQSIQRTRQQLLSIWQSMTIENSTSK